MTTPKKPSPSRAAPRRSPTKKRTHRVTKRSTALRVPAQHTVRSTPSLSDRLPMVGIGASAGGLEAIEMFFTHMPSDRGLALVVLTHHPPQHVSLLPDLLARCTTMPVIKADDGMRIAPNHVYIAPSNRYLSVLQGTLHHLEATPGESLQIPLTAALSRAATREDKVVVELEQKLQQTEETLQKTVEELAIAHAEFKLHHEAMQSTNEELQSANEELETTREELQSINEELQTVNTELHSKVDDLSEVQDNMANLLDSIDIAVIFLDNDLHIKRFTTQATRVASLLHTDVGRPLSDLGSTLGYGSLLADAREVLRTLAAKEIVEYCQTASTARTLGRTTVSFRISRLSTT